MKKIQITDATDEQLVAYGQAMQVEGIEAAKTRAQVLAALAPILGEQDFVLVADEPEHRGEATVPDADVVLEDNHDDGPLVTFRILTTDQPGGKEPAYPSVNGRMLVMQRNMVIKAPYAYYHALENAKRGDPYEVDNGPGKAPTIHFADVTNYPLQLIEMPPQAELDEWHKRRGSRTLAPEVPRVKAAA